MAMNLRALQSVHFIGIGGINMSAVAKLLLAAGVRVSGSDVADSEQISILAERGVAIVIGHAASNIPSDAECVVYTSAVPQSNPEREEARRRGIPELTNFQFLGEWFKDQKTIVVCGTHGKSTTTGMLGLMAEQATLDPTVIVGSKVPSFVDGNLRLGASDIFIVEGDEYALHFLEFYPYAVLLNNIELDHTDIFPDLETMIAAFRQLLSKIADGGILVANVGNANVASLIASMQEGLGRRNIRIVRFNGGDADAWKITHGFNAGSSSLSIEKPGTVYRFILNVPGAFNAVNAAGAALMARELGAGYPEIAIALESFRGIWRRFELLRDKDDVRVYSDYGHHPTAVSATLEAAKEMSMDSRVILCFQPHHRNRTKHLFLEFVTAFDRADALVLCEIYDVAGRDMTEDADMSSEDLVDAIMRHDADRGVTRKVQYARNPAPAVKQTLELAEPGDVVIVMGAGDIDAAVRAALSK